MILISHMFCMLSNFNFNSDYSRQSSTCLSVRVKSLFPDFYPTLTICECPTCSEESADLWFAGLGLYYQALAPLASLTSEYAAQSCIMSQIWQIYLCKNIKKSWVKKFVGIRNRQFLGHTLTTTVAFFYKTAFKIQFLP